MAVAERRRGRGGGGAARRAERSAVSFETAKYIERNIPNFEVLNEEALEIIENNAELILEEVGVNFVQNPGPRRSAYLSGLKNRDLTRTAAIQKPTVSARANCMPRIANPFDSAHSA